MRKKITLIPKSINANALTQAVCRKCKHLPSHCVCDKINASYSVHTHPARTRCHLAANDGSQHVDVLQTHEGCCEQLKGREKTECRSAVDYKLGRLR